MPDAYTNCPVMENERFLLRLVSHTDTADLLRVYSDERAVPFFNSDNCHGDDFPYTSTDRMRRAIALWLEDYEKRHCIRWTITDKAAGEGIGTMGYFIRTSDDYFTDCGILRLDLRSDWERAVKIRAILDVVIEPLFDLFPCRMMATKAIPEAAERIYALEKAKFRLSPHKLRGHGMKEYGSYYILKRPKKE